MERWTIVGEMDWLLNLEGMVGCLSTNDWVERRVSRVVAVQSIVTKVAGLPKLPFRETWRRLAGRGSVQGAKDNGEVGRQCSRQFPHVAFSKTYFSFSPSSSDLRSSSGLYVWPRLRATLLVDRFPLARIFLPSFCLFFFFFTGIIVNPNPFPRAVCYEQR